MMEERFRCVSVVGGAACSPSEADHAFQVGKRLAENGIGVVCGGRGGVMEAACAGAFMHGGMTIGILPGQTAVEANPYLRVVIPTGLSHARNTLVILAGEVVIAIGGGYGTLSEIGLALTHGRKVIGLGTWDVVSGSGDSAEIERVSDPDHAVELALKAMKLSV
jgi:uncharacterized protein (TIGR00725 family)